MMMLRGLLVSTFILTFLSFIPNLLSYLTCAQSYKTLGAYLGI